jgi:hypothetical protein
MSLDYDLTRVSNWEQIEWPKVQSVIFSTMLVGLGEITEATAPKFYARVRAYERVTGSTLTTTADGQNVPTTPADIRALIGLRTNVFPAESDTKFARKLLGWATDNARREWAKKED